MISAIDVTKTYAGQAANPEARGIRPWLGRHKKKLIVGRK